MCLTILDPYTVFKTTPNLPAAISVLNVNPKKKNQSLTFVALTMTNIYLIYSEEYAMLFYI